MKRIIPKCYFDKARQMYPNEKNKTRLMDIATMLKIIANSRYGLGVQCNDSTLDAVQQRGLTPQRAATNTKELISLCIVQKQQLQ